ncbi:36915_t:CDS:2, partial [Racocetra persica]
EKGGTNPDGNSTGKYLVLKFLNQVRANPSGGFKDILGMNEEVPKEQPENEESTRRKYKNPSKGGNKNKPLITPDLLYANTVDLKYDFLEFANRYCSPALVFRFQYSNDLLNFLVLHTVPQ